MTNNSLAGRDLVSINDLSKDEILLLLDQTDRVRKETAKKRQLDLLRGVILATLFYEPSTRTRLSFEAAMHRLGGQVLTVANAKATSSAVKGESIADAARTIAGYADIIVQRHPQVCSAQEAADAVNVPLINAGDGTGEHPTQALLDLYTIRHEKGHLDKLTVALAGDLKHGRTVHSLAQALSHWQAALILVSPKALKMDAAQVARLQEAGLSITETDDLQSAVQQADVLYVTRIQKERFDDPAEYEQLRGSYILDPSMLRENQEITIMHPLPRVDEIALEVDTLPNAAYFRQAANGVWARMALLALLMDQSL